MTRQNRLVSTVVHKSGEELITISQYDREDIYKLFVENHMNVDINFSKKELEDIIDRIGKVLERTDRHYLK